MPYKPSVRLNKEIAQNIIKNIDNYLFDCDGVIWNWPQPIQGSVEFINKLKSLGKKCFFITNNSTKTRETYVEMMKKIGIEKVDENDIVCTAWLLASYLKSIDFKHKVYVVGNTAMSFELDKQNIKHFGVGPNSERFKDISSFDYVKSISLDEEVKCVAVGFDHHFNYPKMIEATSYAYKNTNCLFVATNDDAVFPSGSDSKIVIPGTGTFVNAIKTSIGRDPIILGKPHPTMWKVLHSVHNLDPAKSIMFGDRLDTDIAFAANCHLAFSFAVLSGVTNEQEIENYSKLLGVENANKDSLKLVPDFYANCLGDFEKLF